MVREGLTPEGRSRRALASAIALALCGCAGLAPGDLPPAFTPPPAPREFRGAWIATVANIDWPSRPGLPAEAQKAQIRGLVERAHATGLNALIVQVRPAADAIYPSALEPWSEYLTGEQGRAPEPFYDPLALWIEEAHGRGLELHAWFNPYRARHFSAKGPLAASHLANTAPQLVKTYANYLWLDPGEAAAARHTLAVILDVVRRYDIDGVHIDDYFYPYPVQAPEANAELDFPDDAPWQSFLAAGGTLSRADWRRRNVDALVERIHAGVHQEKSHVRFGISPFGLGRPDRRPPGITGFSQYDKLYADVEGWLAKGWLDYLAPQLYWPIDQAAQAFGPLLDYWQGENARGRHIWPGLFTSRIDDTPKSWTADEILNQVALARARGATGQIHFSMAALAENRKSVAERLRSSAYAREALVPASPWLAASAPEPPEARLAVAADGDSAVVLVIRTDRSVARYAVWARYGEAWTFSVVPAVPGAAKLAARTESGALRAVVVSAVDRIGTESARILLAAPGA